MSSGLTIIRDALVADRPEARAKNWRDSLRQRLGPNGEKLHNILADLAEGRAWMVELPDGRCSAPVLPSSDVRLRAAVFLHEALYGKAVPQTEIQRAEQEAKELKAIQALDDDALEREAFKIIEARRVNRLNPENPQLAEFVATEDAKDVPLETVIANIWSATSTEEQDT